jgi:hypothetical protein
MMAGRNVKSLKLIKSILIEKYNFSNEKAISLMYYCVDIIDAKLFNDESIEEIATALFHEWLNEDSK